MRADRRRIEADLSYPPPKYQWLHIASGSAESWGHSCILSPEIPERAQEVPSHMQLPPPVYRELRAIRIAFIETCAEMDQMELVTRYGRSFWWIERKIRPQHIFSGTRRHSALHHQNRCKRQSDRHSSLAKGQRRPERGVFARSHTGWAEVHNLRIRAVGNSARSSQTQDLHLRS